MHKYNDFSKYVELLLQIVHLKAPGRIEIPDASSDKYSSDFLDKYSKILTQNNITYNVSLSYDKGNIIANCSLKATTANTSTVSASLLEASTVGVSAVSRSLYFNNPIHASVIDDRTTLNPAICTPFIYMPFAFKNIESEPKHAIIGTYMCGDCVGILGWDSRSGASLAYHMKDCDDELLAIGLARFVLAAGYMPNDLFKTSLDCLVNNKQHENNNKIRAVNDIFELIKKDKLLESAHFTFASLSKENRPYAQSILEKAGVTKDQITEIESGKAILHRKNGMVETDFEYNSDTNELTLNKKDKPYQSKN